MIPHFHQQMARGGVVKKWRAQRNHDIEFLRAANRADELAGNIQRPAEDQGIVSSNIVRKRGTETLRIARGGGQIELNVRHGGSKCTAIKAIRAETQFSDDQSDILRKILR